MSKLGFLLIYQRSVSAMNAAIGTTYCQPETHTLDATRRSRKAADQAELCFALRLQRVDGRRLDAFVADLHCSRVHRGAAPIVSYVSALPVRVQSVRVCIACFVASCSWGCACGRARDAACLCVCVHASCHPEQRARGGRAQRGIASYEC